MGLFSKRNKGVGSDQVQQDIEALGQRLAAAEQARADLETRLGMLDDANHSLSGRITTLDEANALLDTRFVGLEDGLSTTGDRLNALSASTSAHDERLATVDDLDARLHELAARLNRPVETPTPPPPPSTTERVGDIDEVRKQLDALTARMAAADERVTSVSTELANQLTELSRDIDALNQQQTAEHEAPAIGDTTAPARADVAEVEARLTERLDAAIDDVLDSTERLAAEQARYEIQFRSDLAELAERLRRPPTR